MPRQRDDAGAACLDLVKGMGDIGFPDRPPRGYGLPSTACGTSGVPVAWTGRCSPGTCTIAASADRLVLRVEAADEENLRRIQDVLTRDIDRFGRRERLTVNWHSPEAPGEAPAG